MYSAYFEHLRHTLNTYLKRPIRDPFVTNTKKCVMTVVRNQNRTIEAGYLIKQDSVYLDQAQTLLLDASRRMFAKDEGSEFTSPLMRDLLPLKRGVTGVVKRNRKELDKYSLIPYFRTREFRRKIAKIYYPIIASHSYECRGLHPVFKLAPDYKPPPTVASANTARNKRLQSTQNRVI
jgi:hypothetical protein